MPSQLESALSTPVSVRAISSTFSDIESTISLDGGKELSRPSTPQAKDVHPEFAFSDSNIEIQTSDQSFWVHEHLLSKFSVLVRLIHQARGTASATNPSQRTTITCDQSSTDFYRTFQVVYASVINGPPQFDVSTLTSALRIASAYDYPELRTFAITSLEVATLTAIDRVRLSDEFVIPSWEKPAFTELCQRTEPITPSEAQVLGMDRFVEIARIRETEQRHRLSAERRPELVDSLVESLKAHCLSGWLGKNFGSPSNEVGPHGTAIPSSLPACDCSVLNYCDYGENHHSVAKCSLHTTAPLILTECRSLLEERNKLVDRLNSLSAADLVETNGESSSADTSNLGTMLQMGGDADFFSLESELSKASWIRSERPSV